MALFPVSPNSLGMWEKQCAMRKIDWPQSKLEVHGRARREAARRRKSEWKVNLGSRNSSHSNGRSNEKLQ